jgi:MFS family permease
MRLFGRFPRTFWVLWAGTLVNRIGMMVLPFLSLYLTVERGLPIAQATLVVGLHGAGSFVAGLVGGSLSDRLGRRAVLVGSLAGGAVLLVAIGQAPGVMALAGLVALYGLVGEAYRPAVSAAVADTVAPADQREAFALLYWAINVGAAIGPALGGALAERGFAWLFWLDAATVAAYAVVVAVGVPETRPARVPDAPLVRRGMLAALADARLMAATLAVFAIGTGFLQAFVTLPLTMRADGLTPADYGLAAGLNGALVVALSLPIARWAAGRPAPGVLAGGAAFVGLGLAVLAWAHTLPGVALGIALLSVGEMAFLPILPAVVARFAPDGQRGAYQGVYQSGWGLAATVGPVLGGIVLSRLGATALWTGASALAFVAAAGILATGLGGEDA